jgi:hypothetical protein
MVIKHVAVPAAMAIFARMMVSGIGPAQADQIKYERSCSFDLGASDGTQDGTIWVHLNFTTSTSGASVLANRVWI